MAWLEGQGVPAGRIHLVPRADLDHRMDPKRHRGVLAEAEPVPTADLADVLDEGGTDPRVLLFLDGVQDAGNLGALLRTAEFFGAAAVVTTKDRSAPMTPAAVRASAGASERLPLARVTNLARALRTCRDAGYWIYGTVVEGGQPLEDVAADPALPGRRVLVFGSEHAGLRRLSRAHCDMLVTIPRRGSIGSLNVAAAAAVVLARLGPHDPRT